jgi:copper(I)-binding protein
MDRRYFLVIGILAILLATGCMQGEPKISVHDAYFIVSPMEPDAISIFMNIENRGGADNLISAKIKEFPNARVELHDVAEGMMLKVDKIEIPAKKIRQLKMGSYHIMAFGIEDPGEEITVVLNFEKSSDIEVKAKYSKMQMQM